MLWQCQVQSHGLFAVSLVIPLIPRILVKNSLSSFFSLSFYSSYFCIVLLTSPFSHLVNAWHRLQKRCQSPWTGAWNHIWEQPSGSSESPLPRSPLTLHCLSLWFPSIFNFFLPLPNVLLVCLSVHCACSALGDQQRASNHLELELEMLQRHHVGAGNQARWWSVLLTAEQAH